jgi:hypothetical protein
MSKRKGMSHDEKRQAMLDILHDTKDTFQLKVAHCCSCQAPSAGVASLRVPLR